MLQASVAVKRRRGTSSEVPRLVLMSSPACVAGDLIASVLWKAMVDADLSQRPTWGMEIRRLYEDEVSNLADLEASLKR